MGRLTTAMARLLGAVAEQKAAAMGVPMAVALADATGSLLYFARMEGTLPASTSIAIAKAYTAASLRLPTAELGRLARPGGELYGIQHTLGGRAVLFGGGIPLELGTRVVGAVGISGGTVAEDIQVAQPVVQALKEMEKWAVRAAPLPTRPPENPDPAWLQEALAMVTKILKEAAEPDPFEKALIVTGALLLAAR